MLQKRIDLGSIPYGLAIAGENIVKGSAVIVKNVGGILKAFLPSTKEEADGVLGFATFRIEQVGGADKDFDVLKKGQRIVIYTLVKNNQWATTEFVGAVEEADELVVGYEAEDKGKLRKPNVGEDDRAIQFVVYRKYGAGEGYTDPIIDVDVK